MPLINTEKKLTPHNLSAVNQNLDSLLSLGKKKPIDANVAASELALGCFKDIQNAQPGVCHYVMKYTTQLAAGTAAITGPVALMGGAAYSYGYDLVNDPFGSLVKLGTTYGTVGITAIVAHKGLEKVGINPLKLLVGGVLIAIGCGAKKACDCAGRRYDKIEKQAEKFSQEGQTRLVGYLKDTYQGMARALEDRLKKNVDDPIAIYTLQQQLIQFEANLPKIQQAFSELGVAPYEAEEIIQPLLTAIKPVKDHQLVLRSSKSATDDRFNMKLLTVLPKSAASSIALSQTASTHLGEAEKHRLGLMHTAKTCVASLASAATTTVAVPVAAAFSAYFLHQPAFDRGYEIVGGNVDFQSLPDSQTLYAGGALALTGLATLGVTAKTASNVYQSYRNERKACDGVFEMNAVGAKFELKDIYDGIATQLNVRLEGERLKREANPGHLEIVASMEQLKKDAAQIQQKLPIIEKTIRARKVIQDPQDVTAELRKTLELIKSA